MLKAVVSGWPESTQYDLLKRTVRTPWTFSSVFSDNPDAELSRELADADAFVGHALTPEIISHARKLRLVHCGGAGVDGLCVDLLLRDCAVCNVHEHEVPIAEYVMLNMLLLASRQPEYERAFRQGQWMGSGRFNGAFHDELAGATVGVIGYGHIGREVVKRAKAFDMRVMAIRRTGGIDDGLLVDWSGTREQLDELLAASDYIVIACPLTPETRGMIGERELRRMKPSAVLINPSRAHIINEEPLFAALRDKRIKGAALDVWYQYPNAIDQNMHGSRLPFHELANVIVTPHVSAWTEAMMQRRFRKVAANLDRFARGESLVSVIRRGA